MSPKLKTMPCNPNGFQILYIANIILALLAIFVEIITVIYYSILSVQSRIQ